MVWILGTRTESHSGSSSGAKKSAHEQLEKHKKGKTSPSWNFLSKSFRRKQKRDWHLWTHLSDSSSHQHDWPLKTIHKIHQWAQQRTDLGIPRASSVCTASAQTPPSPSLLGGSSSLAGGETNTAKRSTHKNPSLKFHQRNKRSTRIHSPPIKNRTFVSFRSRRRRIQPERTYLCGDHGWKFQTFVKRSKEVDGVSIKFRTFWEMGEVGVEGGGVYSVCMGCPPIISELARSQKRRRKKELWDSFDR